MKIAISNEVKLSIALAALQNSELRIQDLAEQFDVSPSSVKRAKRDYADEALKQLELLKAEQSKVIADPFGNYRGARPRNGRMSIIRAVIAELGAQASPSELYERVAELSLENNLYPIKRSAVYVRMRAEFAKLNK